MFNVFLTLCKCCDDDDEGACFKGVDATSVFFFVASCGCLYYYFSHMYEVGYKYECVIEYVYV